MAKINKTIAKLKSLYTDFGHEYAPYSAKEIKEVQKTITLPKILEEYYKKIGSLDNEETDFPIHVLSPSNLSFLEEHLVYAYEMQGVCAFAIKKNDLTLDNPPIYTDMDGKGWQLASSLNDDEETNFDNLLEFFYTIARSMGVDPEPRNTEENVNIVRAVLTGDLSEDAITDEVIKNITHLKFENLEVKNLQAIAKLKNLVIIVINHSNITTIEPFLDLPKLNWLQCYDNAISNIDGAEKMKVLRSFHLSKNKIVDISPIAKMECLACASFGWNAIKDISVIATMPKLKQFSVESNQIVNFPIFQTDSQLYDLRLNDNKISNIDSLTRLKKLNVLWLRGNPIKDTSVFKKLEYIEYLVVDE